VAVSNGDDPCKDDNGNDKCGYQCPAGPCECHEGVRDCANSKKVKTVGQTCAAYNNKYSKPDDQTFTLVMAIFVACAMAFGIGANDAANSWATSVGSNAIQLKYAVIIGGIFEWIGATSLGHGVSKAIQKGVSKVTVKDCWACGYCDSEMGVFMGGMFGALVGASAFLLLSTRFAVPVSTTHSIVGGVVGATLAGAGGHCLNWEYDGGLGGIVASWAISPAVSGLVAMVMYLLSKKFIIGSSNPRRMALIAIPSLYGLSSAAIFILMFFKSKALKKDVSPDAPYTWKWIIGFLLGGVVSLLVTFFFIPYVKKNLPSALGTSKDELLKYKNFTRQQSLTVTGTAVEMQQSTEPKAIDAGNTDNETAKHEKDASVIRLDDVADETADDKTVDVKAKEADDFGIPDDKLFFEAMDEEQLDALHCFKYLLIFNAMLESFAHGSNDTANATGPMTAIYEAYDTGLYGCNQPETPWWILFIAGAFVCMGIITFGRRVIATIGSNLTILDFHRAFYIEFGSTVAVIFATIQEWPVSTTHCQVGAVTAVGLVSVGHSNVNYKLLLKIILSWCLTLPIAGAVAAIFVSIFRAAVTK